MGVSAVDNFAGSFSADDKRGTSLQPRTLVISFPRSGLNWLRHRIEHFSGSECRAAPKSSRKAQQYSIACMT